MKQDSSQCIQGMSLLTMYGEERNIERASSARKMTALVCYTFSVKWGGTVYVHLNVQLVLHKTARPLVQ